MGGVAEDRTELATPTILSPAESLCLGRCHVSHHVARDTVVLMFGSSKPSTNGMLGYDLNHDEFIRPKVKGCLPESRLCCASAFLPNQGAIWVHSGWSTHPAVDGPIDAHTDTQSCLLHLAPSLSFPRPFTLQASPRPARPITDEQAIAARRRGFLGHLGTHMLIMNLFQQDNPRESAREWLINQGPWSEQQALVLHMVAEGHLVIRQGDDESDDADDDDDEDYEENDNDDPEAAEVA